ncbi:siroheme synthase [Pontibacillus halophilus JSM 076056 = DSM 19796]|uniref:precorrin-2 dehydrogenase n=1 Tax=Pontibacillus halophilus JSM 076056 = DSM 19796 TaxID=1385510 RepID=A0A0A5GP10_9BACI|nr:NAD(P)-binding protein [Pontibacillus halophilus]KGX92968.1 siroheme synthase [Pontibacillus halophilus JSM 076056 = DSM 19796]
MTHLPVMLQLNERVCVVCGGGRIATKRVAKLLTAGACVTVISPEVSDKLYALADAGEVIWKRKKVEFEDLGRAFVVVIATNDEAENNKIHSWCGKNQLVNAVHNGGKSDLHFPSSIKRGDLTISVSTNGASPSLAARIKEELGEAYDERYQAYVQFLREFRAYIHELPISKHEQRYWLHEAAQAEYIDTNQQAYIWERVLELGGDRDDETTW